MVILWVSKFNWAWAIVREWQEIRSGTLYGTTWTASVAFVLPMWTGRLRIRLLWITGPSPNLNFPEAGVDVINFRSCTLSDSRYILIHSSPETVLTQAESRIPQPIVSPSKLFWRRGGGMFVSLSVSKVILSISALSSVCYKGVIVQMSVCWFLR